MLANPATTGTNPQSSEQLQWIIGGGLDKIAQDIWKDFGSFLAHSAWQATKPASMNNGDMRGHSVQSIPKHFKGDSKWPYAQWLAQFAYH